MAESGRDGGGAASELLRSSERTLVNSRRVEQELLFNPDGPALSLLVATPSDIANLLMGWTPAHREWDVLRVRGTKSSDEARFFDELAAALQFPYYFGENWDAVWDCITDLNWLRGLSYLVIFDSAEYLLSESDRGFQVLLDELTDAHALWHRETADFGGGDRRPIAFQSVLACDPDYVDALTRRMRDADANFEVL
jgi:RNAse (barnase) inhibitor barstar